MDQAQAEGLGARFEGPEHLAAGYSFIRWGLRRRNNEQMRQAFIAEVNALLTRLEIPLPDPTAGRRYR